MISLLFNRDDAIRAHSGTESTTDAFFLILHKRRGIALTIELVASDGKAALRASVNAQPTALAQIRVKSYLTHFSLLFRGLSGRQVEIFFLKC